MLRGEPPGSNLQQPCVYLFADRPGLFDVVFDLFVGPGKTAAIDALWIVYFEAVFVVAIDYNEMTTRSKVA